MDIIKLNAVIDNQIVHMNGKIDFCKRGDSDESGRVAVLKIGLVYVWYLYDNIHPDKNVFLFTGTLTNWRKTLVFTSRDFNVIRKLLVLMLAKESWYEA